MKFGEKLFAEIFDQTPTADGVSHARLAFAVPPRPMDDDFVPTLAPLDGADAEDDGGSSSEEFVMAVPGSRGKQARARKRARGSRTSSSTGFVFEMESGAAGGADGGGSWRSAKSGAGNAKELRQQPVVAKIRARLDWKKNEAVARAAAAGGGSGEDGSGGVDGDNESGGESSGNSDEDDVSDGDSSGSDSSDGDSSEDGDQDDGGEKEEKQKTNAKKENKAKPQRQSSLKKKKTDQSAEKRERVNRSAPPDATDFSQLKLSRPLLKAVRDMGFTKPTPVQSRAIPPGLAGKDLLVNAQTGSGKTAAFMLPVLERLLYRPRRVAVTRVVVVTPTRELANQILEMGQQLGKYTDARLCLVVGGLSMAAQATALRQSPDIIVATPGRLIDHLRNSQSVDVDGLEILILDEADRLLDMGFCDELEELVRLCPRSRQTMLFSATLTDNVGDLVDLSLRTPVRISVQAVSVVDTLAQEFVRVREQFDTPAHREAVILSLCKRTFKSGHTIVFMPSKKQAHRLMIIFGIAGLRAAELHGQLTQQQRLDALRLFHRDEVDFLLCTDLAARGLDVKGVRAVINFSMPRDVSRYIHRVGRTARAGRRGKSVTLVGEKARKNLRTVVKMAKEAAKSRTVPAGVIRKCRAQIEAMEPDIRAILEAEYQEKLIRIAEMESSKGINMIVHRDTILRRPAKTWFQSEKDKQAVKARTRAALQGAPSSSQPAARAAAAATATTKKQKKKDPLRGLTRKKRRRKIAMMEAEKDRQEYEKRIAEVGGTAKKTAERRMEEAVQRAKSKAKRRGAGFEGTERAEARGRRDAHRFSSDGLDDSGWGGPDASGGGASEGKSRRRRRKRRFLDTSEADPNADTFAKRYKDVTAERPEVPKKKFRAGGKSKKAFKSKGRYKRRS